MPLRKGAELSTRAQIGDSAAKFPELGFHDRGVVAAEAHHDLLAGRSPLELVIGEFVKDFRLHELDIRGHVGRREQVVDHLHQTIVEVRPWVAELLVGLLEERIEPGVERDELLRIRRADEPDLGCVARRIVRAHRVLAAVADRPE